MNPADIAAWRESGGQSFADITKLSDLAMLSGVETVPRLVSPDLPVTIEETLEWLRSVAPRTIVPLDGVAKGKAEGVVVRTATRSQIAKIRFEDYERTMKSKVSP